LFLVIGIGSGAYPAWYISAFKPVAILKGKEKMTGKNMLTKVFLTGQFFLTFIAVVSGLIFTQNNKNQEKMDWGYTQDGVLVLPIKNNEQYTVFQQWAEQSADILDYSGSINQIGKSNSEEVIDMGTSKFAVDAFLVDFNYPQTMGLRLNWGRFFDENLKSDADQSILVNEKFLDKFGWEESDLPQKLVKIDNNNYSIIGVVEDFHHFDFFNPITPSIIRIGAEENFKYISLKTKDNTNTENQVKNVWAGKFPDTPYAGFFQDVVFEVFFQNTSVLINIMNFTAFIAIVLSSMGLFGLVSLLIVKRLKELSIRNVLGAKGTDIVMLISKQFLWLFGFALIFAIPVSYILFSELLSQMFLGNPVKLGPGPFVFTLVILVAIIILTVSSHMIQLLRRNPVDSLRLE
jgi:ABC-type antimicrobial peptide transport system permease subunit